jgi:hypothetical protein
MQHRPGGTAKGGKALYGAPVGILMLEARFPRIPGDVGNALSFPFPVLYAVVPGASPDRVVRRRAEGLLDSFIAEGRKLVRQGAEGIVTNCGFLALYQGELAAALEVPVATSSLLQVPFIERLLPPGRRVGILTIAAGHLSAEHLAAAGVAPDTPIAGTPPDGHFVRAILDDGPELEPLRCEAEVVEAALGLVASAPEIGALVLECTNMCPYSRAVRRRLDLPVFDMLSLIAWFQQGLRPPVHPPFD